MDVMDMQIYDDYITQTITMDDSVKSDRSFSPRNDRVNPLVKCSTCGEGYLKDRYTPCGYILACVFFPCGIIFCVALKKRVCSKCEVEVSN